MKTDDLISFLATDATPVDRYVLGRRFATTVLIALAGATVIMATMLGVRPDIRQVAVTPIFWLKLAFPLFVLCGSIRLASQLARPGARTSSGWLWTALPIAMVWFVSVVLLINSSPDERIPLIMGRTWRVCPFNITILSVPGMLAAGWALKGMSPVRLRAAGFAGGLIAGSSGTLAYCLHCPEMGVAFWGVWYLLGMCVPAVIGALLGRRLLRW
ncbi:DUF1109 domain-containing protein [Paraburkholderia caribensis]|uniref:DUF1109 domain-containing protein n=1 Tax=Paraburkholderia TaxID=1822464 RepID=UPI001CAB1DD9|nr:DUF1109 domain-containing protein [Paraburkholderia caribensis]BEU25752.1 DUF1109 domain-containing protein [Paraburkholderia sp. 22B1P]CAG9242826.1 putative anti-sigma-F factor NrsF [Paraburkholderia caribensis]